MKFMKLTMNKAWNGKMISEPILNPKMKNNLECRATVLWGNYQSELLKLKQRKLILDENWKNNSEAT